MKIAFLSITFIQYLKDCLNPREKFFFTLKVPEKLQLYGLYVYYVVHICDFGMLRIKTIITIRFTTT